MSTDASDAHPSVEFSIVEGGPLYRFFVWSRLVRPPADWAYRRVLAFLLVAWVPLVTLTLISGRFFRGVRIPFLSDLDANTKLLVAAPLLIGAEQIIHRHVRRAANEFLDRKLIASRDVPRFEGLVNGAVRLRNSTLVEAMVLLVAFAGGHSIWRAQALLTAATWYATPHLGGSAFTPAGYWYVFISLPLARFILLRWYFRLLVWYAFLWRVSRLKLNINALHPDRAGGLGFLEHTVTALVPVLVAQSAFLSGAIGSRILLREQRLIAFKFEMGSFVLFLLVQALLPLMFFVVQLIRARLHADHAFGRLAMRYVTEFSDKWMSPSRAPNADVLGSPDIQSLADLANSFGVVHSMRAVPFDPRLALRVTIVIVLPLLPLALTMVPLEELVRSLVRLLM